MLTDPLTEPKGRKIIFLGTDGLSGRESHTVGIFPGTCVRYSWKAERTGLTVAAYGKSLRNEHWTKDDNESRSTVGNAGCTRRRQWPIQGSNQWFTRPSVLQCLTISHVIHQTRSDFHVPE